MKKKRTDITVELNEVMFLRRRRNGSLRVWCPSCRHDVIVVMPEQAAVIARVTVRTINGWVESGKVHFQETPDGLLWLCLNSLPEQ